MTTNQESRQQNLRDQAASTHNTSSDWHAYWDNQGVAAGTFNERMLTWINSTLGTSYTNVTGAMHAFAVNRGFSSWASINDLSLISFDSGDVILMESGDRLLLETGDGILIDF